MLTGICFYCSNPINFEGRYAEASIRHHYADGSTRDSERRFHIPCLGKLEMRGRPWNPQTKYEVLAADEFEGQEDDPAAAAGKRRL